MSCWCENKIILIVVNELCVFDASKLLCYSSSSSYFVFDRISCYLFFIILTRAWHNYQLTED